MTESKPNERDDAFEASMPESYRRNFDGAAVAVHARLSNSRAKHGVKVGSFPSARPGTALCVVADDRPGLLATISAALVIQRLDVIEAEAYTRRERGRPDEAVDVFWVRHDPPEKRGTPVTPEDVEGLRATLSGL
ncbi:MAG TPA: hypothetical protein VFZ53_03810, partial [Polyangiaceae bacterium]